MADRYLQDDHAFSVARNMPQEATRVDPKPDEGTSWVMLSRSGSLVKLPHEKILYTTNSRVSLDVSVPKSPQGRTPTPFTLKSDNGTTYITNQRIIYLPAKTTEDFKSFAAPILNFEDSHIGSPWFGSWYWSAVVTPVAQGGIPPDIARVDLKLTFKEGGHNDFVSKFEELKERLYHIRDIERETGQTLRVPDEPLPAYEAPEGLGASSSGGGLAPVEAPARSDSATSRGRGPDEPPPDYEEAQAQSISMRLEDHIRGSADRGSDD
ncbi:uncharacterized protein DNG_07636 [Cephalotrichum gorgonifer]|uniref:Uncharacterized protein n=1 Tax=Cephalotrichum gorgonifer TaxID=2041049 RepID=A0AAE8SXL1_9PEZI|nr:uncharacterized protein DNG_07636 [Cephalotrichum gorgonifer]